MRTTSHHLTSDMTVMKMMSMLGYKDLVLPLAWSQEQEPGPDQGEMLKANHKMGEAINNPSMVPSCNKFLGKKKMVIVIQYQICLADSMLFVLFLLSYC